MNRRSEKIFTLPYCAYLCALLVGAWWIFPTLKTLVLQPQPTINDLASPEFQNDPNNLIQKEPIPVSFQALSPPLPSPLSSSSLPDGAAPSSDASLKTSILNGDTSKKELEVIAERFPPSAPSYPGAPPAPPPAPPHLSFFISLAPNKTRALHGVEYRTNHAGFRDDQEYSTAVDAKEQRIAFVGDSFTFGWGVELRDTIPALIRAIGEKSEQQWRIFNFGIPAYNLRDVTLLLHYRALHFKPNTIVYLLHLNDGFAETPSTFGSGAKTNDLVLSYLLGTSGNTEEDQKIAQFVRSSAPQFVSDVLGAWGFSSLTEARREQSFLRLFLEYFTTLHLPIFWNDFVRHLNYLGALADFTKATVVVALLPALDFPWKHYPFDLLHEKIERECKRLGFTVINLKPLLERYPNKELMLWGYDGHTNAFANKLIAEKLAAELQKISR